MYFLHSCYKIYLLPVIRLETQYEQKRALLARLDTNIKNRDLLLSKKNQAVHVLENLQHSTKTAAEQ